MEDSIKPSKEVVNYFMGTLNKKLFYVEKKTDEEMELLWVGDNDELDR